MVASPSLDDGARAARRLRRPPDFIAMIGCFMALNAFAIDAILPALSLIQSDFGVGDDNSRQWTIVAYLSGIGFSQPFAGPITDRFGRRNCILLCFGGYVLISLMCQLAWSFQFLILCRFVHGLIGGAIRVITISMVRDSYSGPEMAAKMSIATMVLMAAPLFAPALGQLILILGGGWRGIFFCMAAVALAITLWTTLRLPETLSPSKRTSLRPSAVARGYARVLQQKEAVAYFLVHAMTVGAIFTYVTLAQQIYHDIYGVGAMFPIFFAAAGIVIIIANLCNIALIAAVGMRRLAHIAVAGFTAISLIHALAGAGGSPPLWMFISLLMLGVFCLGVLMPNSASLAMQPFDRDAGYAAAFLGFAGNCVGALSGAVVGGMFAGAAVTLLWGHAALGAASLVIILIVARGRPFGPDTPGASRKPG